jgi:hypothetical protein
MKNEEKIKEYGDGKNRRDMTRLDLDSSTRMPSALFTFYTSN